MIKTLISVLFLQEIGLSVDNRMDLARLMYHKMRTADEFYTSGVESRCITAVNIFNKIQTAAAATAKTTTETNTEPAPLPFLTLEELERDLEDREEDKFPRLQLEKVKDEDEDDDLLLPQFLLKDEEEEELMATPSLKRKMEMLMFREPTGAPPKKKLRFGSDLDDV